MTWHGCIYLHVKTCAVMYKSLYGGTRADSQHSGIYKDIVVYQKVVNLTRFVPN